MPPFRKILRGHVRTVPVNMHIKFEVRSFNRFKLVRLDWSAAQRHKHTHTYIEQKQYHSHSLHSLGGDNKTKPKKKNKKTQHTCFLFSHPIFPELLKVRLVQARLDPKSNLLGIIVDARMPFQLPNQQRESI